MFSGECTCLDGAFRVNEGVVFTCTNATGLLHSQ